MTAKLRLVSARAAPKRAARRRKKRTPISADYDPRAKMRDRTFELSIVFVHSEHTDIKRIRMRVAKSALEDNVFHAGTTEVYCGLVSEPVGKSWSTPRWGHVPVSQVSWVREVVSDDVPKEIGQ